MRVSEKLLEIGVSPDTADFSDILALLAESDSLAIKKDDVGTDLASLVSFADVSRTGLADTLGYEKSRITRILSGMENLTLRTIHDVCKAVGYEFDVIFRKKTENKPFQPWQFHEVKLEQPFSLDLYTMQATKSVNTSYPNNVHYIPVANDSIWHLEEAAA